MEAAIGAIGGPGKAGGAMDTATYMAEAEYGLPLVLDDAKASAEPANGSAAPPAGVSASPVSRDDETVVESVWKAHAVKATSRGDSRSLATRTGACANRPCLCSLCCSV